MGSMADVQAVLVKALNWLAQATGTLQTLTHRAWPTTPQTA